MGRNFFIGDMHLGDDTIRKLECRPFRSTIEQTDTMVNNWNNIIQPDDTVFIVGDFVHIGCDDYHIEKAKQLSGRKILIRGNHDTESEDFYKEKCGIDIVYDYPIVFNDFFIVSHEPKYINENFPYANFFAHVHNNPIYNTYSCRHYCVSVERIGYKPILFEDMWDIMKSADAIR